MNSYNWEMELELCLLAQGYKYTLWARWLRLLPSPFHWYSYESELKEIITGAKNGN